MSRIIMTKIAIIIPSRLSAQRLPNKPLKLINNKEMILHVYDLALKAKIGEVLVATPDEEIADVIKSHGGKAVITNNNHKTGTDRIFEVFQNELDKKSDIIINLQGDMPNLDSSAIRDLAKHMKLNKCDIGTLASQIGDQKEIIDPDICKVVTEKDIKINRYSKALDFYRVSKKKNNFIYHHIGIYAFTKEALMRYVSLDRTKLEVKRNLEQMRALENEMKINVGYINSYPLSVDTELDLIKIKKIMENK